MAGSETLPAGDNWVEDFYREVDKLDMACLSAAISDDIDVRFGNNPTINGKAAAIESFKAFWTAIAGMAHRRVELVAQGDMAVFMANVTYTRHDGSTVTVPVSSHIRKDNNGKINRLWVYIDLAPLFAQG